MLNSSPAQPNLLHHSRTFSTSLWSPCAPCASKVLKSAAFLRLRVPSAGDYHHPCHLCDRNYNKSSSTVWHSVLVALDRTPAGLAAHAGSPEDRGAITKSWWSPAIRRLHQRFLCGCWLCCLVAGCGDFISGCHLTTLIFRLQVEFFWHLNLFFFSWQL